MMLYDDFRKEKMDALKNKDKLKNKVITNILSDLTYIKKELQQEPTEADTIKVVSKQIKQLKETLELSKDRPDSVEELKKELAILEQYMPEQMSETEIEKTLQQLLLDKGIETTAKNKGIIMKESMAALAGKADGKTISQVVTRLLQ